MPVPSKFRARRRFALLILGCVVALAACAAPAPGSDAMGATPARAAAAPVVPAAAVAPVGPSDTTPRQAPPMSDPLPPQRKPDPDAPASVPAGKPVAIDKSCTRDADCAVKNIGNCCGHYPACVNVNSPTDPAAVQAQCAKEGRASVCGFKPVESCQCVQGECQDQLMMFESQ